MTDNTYTALTPIEAIRIRPGMYIGETETPTQLLTEIIDNSFDEISNNFANLFQLNINIEQNMYWVQDNGRGLKVYDMKDANGNIRDSIELLCTETHSGSKFDNSDYGILIGMHGVGMVVVNALSNWMIVKVRDRENRNTIYEYQFINSVLTKKNTYVDLNDVDNWSTCIGFSPCEKYFDSIKMDIVGISQRLILAQARYNTSDLYFNGKQITKRSFYEYVKYILKIDSEFKKLEFKESKNKKIEVYLNYSKGNSSNILCDVNLRHCEGTFLTSFLTILKKSIMNKLGKITNNINPNILLNGLNCYISLTIPEPKFDSQTKTRMTLRINELINPLINQINWALDQDTLDIIQNNLEKMLNKKFKKKVTSRKIISAENKLRDCINTPGDVLYIVEGESALGPLKQVRDVNTEAIYPLKGKILNVLKATIDKISKNKEITDLIEACGPKTNRRYNHIKIIADADFDGFHISVLTILVINKYLQDYIENEKLSVILPPLFGVQLKNDYKLLYNPNEVNQYRQYNVTRFKGLGEMNPDQLEKVIRSNVEYIVKLPLSDQQMNSTLEVIVNTDLKKQIMTKPEFTFNTVLDKVFNTNNSNN